MSKTSTQPSIQAQQRDKFGHQSKALRRSGYIPVEVYGNVKNNLHLAVSVRDFTRLIEEHGTSVIYKLSVSGEKDLKVLVQDLQSHSTRGEFLHADLFAVNPKEKLTTEVPLNFSGEADAVEILGGTLVTSKTELEIECLPEHLPHEIAVDLSVLKSFDDSIRVKDLVLPEGVSTTIEEDEVIVSVSEPISEAELAELEEAPAAASETEFETSDGTQTPPAEEQD